MMKFKSVLAATLFATAFSAHAAYDGDGEVSRFRTDTTTLTREQVRAELAAAIAQGKYGQVEVTVAPADPGVARSRSAVRAELAEARRLGLLYSGEGGVPYPTAAQEEAIAAAGRQADQAIAGLQPRRR